MTNIFIETASNNFHGLKIIAHITETKCYIISTKIFEFFFIKVLTNLMHSFWISYSIPLVSKYIRVQEMSFSENFVYIINEWSLSWHKKVNFTLYFWSFTWFNSHFPRSVIVSQGHALPESYSCSFQLKRVEKNACFFFVFSF